MVDDLYPAPRLLMGPGPINADPRVLRAMSAQLLGQFDPQFRRYMQETSELYRGVFQTKNRWTLLIDGTARSGIEAALASLIEPGDRVLVPVFGRFGNLKVEIARRCGADVGVDLGDRHGLRELALRAVGKRDVDHGCGSGSCRNEKSAVSRAFSVGDDATLDARLPGR